MDRLFEAKLLWWIKRSEAGSVTRVTIDLADVGFLPLTASVAITVLARHLADHDRPVTLRVPRSDRAVAFLHRWGVLDLLRGAERDERLTIDGVRDVDGYRIAADGSTRVLAFTPLATTSEVESFQRDLLDPTKFRTWLGAFTDLQVVDSGEFTRVIVSELAQNIAEHAYKDSGIADDRKLGVVCGQVESWADRARWLETTPEKLLRDEHTSGQRSDLERDWHRSNGQRPFLEVIVADHGCGLYASLAARYPEYRDDRHALVAQLLRRDTARYPRMRDHRAHGLDVIGDIVRRYRGFVSLRDTGAEYALATVGDQQQLANRLDDLARLPGTQVRILLPCDPVGASARPVHSVRMSARPRGAQLAWRSAPEAAPTAPELPEPVRLADIPLARSPDKDRRARALRTRLAKIVPPPAGVTLFLDFDDVSWMRNDFLVLFDVLSRLLPVARARGGVVAGINLHDSHLVHFRPPADPDLDSADERVRMLKAAGAFLVLDHNRQPFVMCAPRVQPHIQALLAEDWEQAASAADPDQRAVMDKVIGASCYFDDRGTSRITTARLEDMRRRVFARGLMAWGARDREHLDCNGRRFYYPVQEDRYFQLVNRRYVPDYISVHHLFEHHGWTRRVVDEMVHLIGTLDEVPDLLVSVTSPGERLMRELVRRVARDTATVSDVMAGRASVNGRRAALITDVLHRGGNVRRLISSLSLGGGLAVALIGVVDARPGDEDEIKVPTRVIVKHQIKYSDDLPLARGQKPLVVSIDARTTEPILSARPRRSGSGKQRSVSRTPRVAQGESAASQGLLELIGALEVSRALHLRHHAGDHHHLFTIDLPALLSIHGDRVAEQIDRLACEREIDTIVHLPGDESRSAIVALQALRRRRQQPAWDVVEVAPDAWEQPERPSRRMLFLEPRIYTGRALQAQLLRLVRAWKPRSVVTVGVISQLPADAAGFFTGVRSLGVEGVPDVAIEHVALYSLRIPTYPPSACPICRVERELRRLAYRSSLPGLHELFDGVDRDFSGVDLEVNTAWRGDELPLQPPRTVAGRALQLLDGLAGALEARERRSPSEVVKDEVARIIDERDPRVVRVHLGMLLRVAAEFLENDSGVGRALVDLLERLWQRPGPERGWALASACSELPDALLGETGKMLLQHMSTLWLSASDDDPRMLGAITYLHERIQNQGPGADRELAELYHWLDGKPLATATVGDRPVVADERIFQLRRALQRHRDPRTWAMRSLERLMRRIGLLGGNHGYDMENLQEAEDRLYQWTLDRPDDGREAIIAGARSAREIRYLWEDIRRQILVDLPVDNYLELGSPNLIGDVEELSAFEKELGAASTQESDARLHMLARTATRLRDAVDVDGAIRRLIEPLIKPVEPTVALLREVCGDKLEIKAPPPRFVIAHDPLENMVRGLVENASKAGQIVHVEIDVPDEILIIRIVDNGPGLNEALFQNGRTLKYTYRLLRQLNGNLSWRPREGGHDPYVELTAWSLR